VLNSDAGEIFLQASAVRQSTQRVHDARPLIATFAESSRIAAAESQVTAGRLSEIPGEWRAMVKARAGSAAAQLLAQLPSRPILSSEDALPIIDGPRSSVFAAINRLHELAFCVR
jgi:hypothetical protein